MEIDWNGLAKISDIYDKTVMVDGVIAKCEKDDPIFLSDCIVRGGAAGSTVLKSLALQEEKALKERRDPMLWKIYVIRDEWGNVPNPGEPVYKVNKSDLKRGDKLVSGNEMNVAMMDGSYSEQFEDRRPYEIDEKGCIECSFTDAGSFLQTRGMHAKSNRPMTTYKSPSSEPVKAPDGKMHLIHYYLYREITKEAYENLPKRAKSNKPKVGHAKKGGSND